jgi:hypothetical protein
MNRDDILIDRRHFSAALHLLQPLLGSRPTDHAPIRTGYFDRDLLAKQ